MVNHDVLADGTKADGAVDLRLGDRRDLDGLCVAATLKVEDGVLCPAVLVIADEDALRVSRKRGLAGAGQAEEDGRLTRDRVHVRGRVHGEHVLLHRHDVVHDREDGLLDLARVRGAGNDDALVLKVDEDGSLGVGAILHRIELQIGCGEHGIVLREVAIALALGRTHEQLARKQRLAGALAHDQELAAPTAIGASDCANHEEVARTQVVSHGLLDLFVVLRRERLVDVAPVDVVMHVGRVNDKAVLRRAAGVLTRLDRESARVRKDALVATQRALDKASGRFVHDHGTTAVVDATNGEQIVHRRTALTFTTSYDVVRDGINTLLNSGHRFLLTPFGEHSEPVTVACLTLRAYAIICGFIKAVTLWSALM